MTDFLFHNTLIVGVGLIGSSIARALREHGISSEIHGIDDNADVLAKCKDLNILTSGKQKLKDYSKLLFQEELPWMGCVRKPLYSI